MPRDSIISIFVQSNHGTLYTYIYDGYCVRFYKMENIISEQLKIRILSTSYGLSAFPKALKKT